jgi:hypothetical protein
MLIQSFCISAIYPKLMKTKNLNLNIPMTVVAGLESRDYGRRYSSRWPRGTLYPQKLALTSPTSGGRSVGIVRSRTLAKKFSLMTVVARSKA